MWSIPNIMTMARILLLPLIVALIYVPEAWAAWTALVFYIIAAVTDFLDGFVARKMNMESAFGRFLDPIADKVFIASLLLLLVGVGRLEGLWILTGVIILARELLISGLREFLGPENVTFPVTWMAKWKTTVQMFALGFLIMGDYGNVVLPYTLAIGHFLIFVAAVLTVITGWDYFKVGLKHIESMDADKL